MEEGCEVGHKKRNKLPELNNISREKNVSYQFPSPSPKSENFIPEDFIPAMNLNEYFAYYNSSCFLSFS